MVMEMNTNTNKTSADARREACAATDDAYAARNQNKRVAEMKAWMAAAEAWDAEGKAFEAEGWGERTVAGSAYRANDARKSAALVARLMAEGR